MRTSTKGIKIPPTHSFKALALSIIVRKITPLSHTPRKTARHDIINRINQEQFSMKRAVEKQEKKVSAGFTATDKLPISGVS